MTFTIWFAIGLAALIVLLSLPAAARRALGRATRRWTRP